MFPTSNIQCKKACIERNVTEQEQGGVTMVGEAQMQYEEEEWEQIEAANELLKQGHARDCAAAMAWTGVECICTPGDWLANRKEG